MLAYDAIVTRAAGDQPDVYRPSAPARFPRYAGGSSTPTDRNSCATTVPQSSIVDSVFF